MLSNSIYCDLIIEIVHCTLYIVHCTMYMNASVISTLHLKPGPPSPHRPGQPMPLSNSPVWQRPLTKTGECLQNKSCGFPLLSRIISKKLLSKDGVFLNSGVAHVSNQCCVRANACIINQATMEIVEDKHYKCSN